MESSPLTTSLLNLICHLDHIIEGLYVSYRRKNFLKLTKDGATDHPGGNVLHPLGTDEDPVPMCLTFVRKCNVIGFALCEFNSIDPL